VLVEILRKQRTPRTWDVSLFCISKLPDRQNQYSSS
jgi:hypothetical protein